MISCKQSTNSNRFDFLTELTVLVGESEQKFVLHKSLVCKSSEFFQASVSVQWKEGQENTIRLPDCTPQTFSTYIGWLYTNEVDFLEEDEKNLPWVENDGTPLTQTLKLTKRAIDCYQLGDMVLDTGFSNAVMDELIKICEKCSTVPSYESIDYAWQKVPHGSKMIELMGNFYSTEMDVKEFDKMLPKLPAEFVFMVARAGIRDKLCDYRMRQPIRKLRCHYHQHRSLEETCTSERCECAECQKA